MADYEKEIEKNIERNKKYIKGFEKWLNEKGLVKKTITKHINNVDLYINDYLNYYDITKAEDGADSVFSFLDGWYIEKCLWVSRTSLKEMASSLKKFYQYMSEENYVSVEEYKDMCFEIKETMDELLEKVDESYEDDYYDLF